MTPPRERDESRHDPRQCALHDLIQKNKQEKFDDHEERINKLEEDGHNVNSFMNWWDREGIGDQIKANTQAMRGVIFVHKALLATMGAAVSAVTIYKALH